MPTRKDRNEDGAKLVLKPDEVEVTSSKSTELQDPEKIIQSRGLNPDDWDFAGLIDNEWESPTGETLHQRKISLKYKNPPTLLMPARTDGPRWEAPKEKKIDSNGALFVFSGDDQAPFQDPWFHDKWCQFLEEVKPHVSVKIGDTMDFPSISKYKKNPEVEEIAQVNDCVTGGYELLRDERSASPDTVIKKIVGNHDVRLRDFIINWVPELHGLKRAQIEGKEEASVFSPEFLLRLDELGVELVGDNANYEHGEIKVSKYLAARHGWIAQKGSGVSALKTLEHLLYSIIVGHTHRLSIVHKSIHNIDGDLTVLAAGESGCKCRIDKQGLGYTPAPDWQHGAITAEVYPDGKFHLDIVNFIDKKLYWRGSRF